MGYKNNRRCLQVAKTRTGSAVRKIASSFFFGGGGRCICTGAEEVVVTVVVGFSRTDDGHNHRQGATSCTEQGHILKKTSFPEVRQNPEEERVSEVSLSGTWRVANLRVNKQQLRSPAPLIPDCTRWAAWLNRPFARGRASHASCMAHSMRRMDPDQASAAPDPAAGRSTLPCIPGWRSLYC